MINRSTLMPVELQSAQILGKRQASAAIRYARLSRAFTLTELLVVIAITTILLGLLFVPIIQGFNITRRAAAETAAQAAVRTGLERISRDLSQAVYVFDNSATPILLPLTRTFPIGPGGVNTNQPHILFAKIDFVPRGGKAPSASVIDPTTGEPMSGKTLTLPLANGTRVIRYFLGLRRNLDAAGAVKPYLNQYEFSSRADGGNPDNEHNPLVVYRAEFDPRDPNLFDLTNYGSVVDGDGGFNDPAFFYNTKQAPNGRSYAQNWRDVASPLVDSDKADMLAWRRDGSGALVTEAPFRTLVTFTPGTIVGDTATPGFMNNAAAEAPGAVPTRYRTKNGQWALPYSVTFFRAAGGAGQTRPTFGELRIRFENEPQADGSTRLRVVPTAASGSLSVTPEQFYTAISLTSGKLFVKTPNLSFQVDARTGAIETGFQPLAGTGGGVPMLSSGGVIGPMVASVYPLRGDLVPMIMRMISRDPNAGTNGVPTNQGLTAVAPFGLGDVAPYYPLSGATLPVSSASPMQVFGNVIGGAIASGGGLMITPGSERVQAPDLQQGSSSISNLVTWYRAAGATTSIAKKGTQLDDAFDASSSIRKRWSVTGGQRNYILDQDTQVNERAMLLFDEPNGPGLPAKSITDGNTIAEREVRLTYLWQNNYSRRIGGDQNGWPVDASDHTLVDLAGGATNGKQTLVVEPDVVKVDYSTRSQLVIQYGVNVYDGASKRATTMQLSDRVKVGNLGR